MPAQAVRKNDNLATLQLTWTTSLSGQQLFSAYQGCFLPPPCCILSNLVHLGTATVLLPRWNAAESAVPSDFATRGARSEARACECEVQLL